MGRHDKTCRYRAKMDLRKRGPMTDFERAEIERLASEMKKPTPGKIAEKLNRLPSTVNWYMLSHSLIERKVGRAPRPYVRNGKTIYPYAEEHDAMIESLRAQGKVFREIGEALTAKFGIERDSHSVQVRLVQLTASPEA